MITVPGLIDVTERHLAQLDGDIAAAEADMAALVTEKQAGHGCWEPLHRLRARRDLARRLNLALRDALADSGTGGAS